MDTQEFRSLGHRVIDLLADYLETVEERPLFPDVTPAAVTALFDEPLPREGIPGEDLVEELREKLLPHCVHVNHPGYFGLITPTPTPAGVLGDLVAAALNQNIGVWTIGPSAVSIERRVVRWLCELVGFDERSGGNLTSGGTMANFIALKLARDAVTGDGAQYSGLDRGWAVYVSEERHVSVDKAVDAVGFGREAMRVLPTDDAFRVDVPALEQALAADRERGIRAACVVALAGTTNTGSVDDLHALRTIADREGAWLHVDACYGGGMLLSRLRPGLLSGLELADSVALDPHKWFYAPLDAGAVLVRDEQRLTRSFGMQPAYLVDESDARQERYAYYVHGFEQSRRFRGLKVWMSFKRYGAEGIGRWIDANIGQAAHLFGRVREHPEFSAATEPPMSAICIRFTGADLEDEEAARLHRDVARCVEEDGRFWISTTHLKGRSWFRINPVNFRTRTEHMDGLLEFLERACRGWLEMRQRTG